MHSNTTPATDRSLRAATSLMRRDQHHAVEEARQRHVATARPHECFKNALVGSRPSSIR